jgi:hypothetical protein
VSDSFDRRILTTYLEEYLGDFLFDAFQPFHLYNGRTSADAIDVPPSGPKDAYTRAIEALPLVQTPEVGSGGEGGGSLLGWQLCLSWPAVWWCTAQHRKVCHATGLFEGCALMPAARWLQQPTLST